MELRRLTKEKEDIKRNKALYCEAFPKIERAPYSMMLRRSRQGKGDFWTFYESNEWVGLAYVVSDDIVAYIFYIAILNSKRGMGLGSKALQLIKDEYKDKKVFLALEKLDENADNYDIRLRRFGFYSRNGMMSLERIICEGGVEFAVMSTGEDIKPEEYDNLMRPFAGKFYIRLYDMKMI